MIVDHQDVLRESRERCGCSCVGACQPQSCHCALNGIECQVGQDDEDDFGDSDVDEDEEKDHADDDDSRICQPKILSVWSCWC